MSSAAIEARGPVAGNLVYTVRSFGQRTFMAQLMTPERKYLVPVLTDARIRISDAGILIAGLEVIPRGRSIKSSSEFHRQTWWCVPRA